MSRTIRIDGYADSRHVVSDVEYAGIDWGSSSDDIVRFEDVNGSRVYLNYARVASIEIPGASPPPGSYPGWILDMTGAYGGVQGLHIDQATKDALVDALDADADLILEFTTLEGTDIKFPSANAASIVFTPGDLVVPV